MKKRFSKIYVEITNVCNLKCKFCLETKREKRFMSLEEFKIVIQKIKPYTDLILLHVKGEPLLHKDLREILKVSEENVIRVNITTNTTLLKENIETLKTSSALRQLNLSIHDLEQNELDRKETFLEIINTINEIKKVNENLIISYRLWNMSKIGENAQNLDFIEMLEKEYGIENITQKCLENDFLKLDENIFLNQDIEFEWPNLDREVISEKGRCYGLRNQIAILVNGDVVPCCLDTDGDMVLGNIFKEDFENILNNEKSQKIINGFENNILTEELCKRCDFIKKFN